MDNPRGRVLSLATDGTGQRAVVAVTAMPVCARCAAGRGCGAGLLAAENRPNRIEAIIAPGLDANVDDEVELLMQPDNLLRAAYFVYGVPMLGAIAGASVAYWLSLGDAGAALMALAGLAVGLMISRWRVRRSACMRQFTPRIERLC